MNLIMLLGLPNLVAYGPCFAREVEWTLLEGLRRCAGRALGPEAIASAFAALDGPPGF